MSRPNLTFPWLLNAIKTHNSDECLLWPFPPHSRYGICRFHGRDEAVHRIAFFLTHGHWPTPCGRHTCDIPICFNPRHIVEGTMADNIADRVERNRSAKGEKLHASHLTEWHVREIRRSFKPRMSMVLAKQFGVSDMTILSIVKHKTWKHVT